MGVLPERARKGREMGEKLSLEDRVNAMKAAELISRSFTWRKSKQGREYWRKVYNELMNIAETGEP